ncbi:hypothetical protein ACMD2_16625 [Ananas comosus]|uniref:Uncharacterized protein n=1 Tax=Ananas comosus TaxID=4615 RepID=A0A199W001_ANACO|nr:hypothetical protein ACMD2_16625 [Ananas comosus]
MVGPSPGTNSVAPFGASQSNAPPVFSSFSQLGAVTNAGSSFRQFCLFFFRASAPGTPSNTVFGQSNSFQNPSQNTTFGQLSSSQNSSPNNIFGQSNSFQNTSQSTNFGRSNSFLNTSQASAGFEMKFGPPVAFGSQLASQPFGSSPGIGMSNFSAGDFKATNNQFFPQPGSSSSQSKSFDDWLKVPSDSANQSSNEYQRKSRPKGFVPKGFDNLIRQKFQGKQKLKKVYFLLPEAERYLMLSVCAIDARMSL